MAYCIYLIQEWRVTPTPISCFFDNDLDGDIRDFKRTDMIRLAICKSNKTLSVIEDGINAKEKDY